ncbi:complex I subunit 4 family protein [Pseudothermotoga thermarum]|uniref:NADH/Ubiquinone/plastoquinone (Complex I) n=1 Tax=Pseudothermotoga thermarum DSM 5069 TaxID=688269 RepID=F7YTZ5_9THEM|nr:complex I subunit 5 family protein [Pseudothermotoga thermarum]AEH51577.1 NADH/Ubiquinone/plastoquinone (complex I) [Pseudothermotoga thermarum DSM 5069]
MIVLNPDMLILGTIVVVSVLVWIYQVEYMKGVSKGYYFLFAGYVLSMILLAFSFGNLLMFLIAFELTLVFSWLLINFWGSGERQKVALKYFIYTEIGALMLFVAFSILFASYSTFDVEKLSLFTKDMQNVAVLITLALFIKSAIFPFHSWMPDAHAEAPTPVSALLSPVMIGLSNYSIFRVVFRVFPTVVSNERFLLFLTVCGMFNLVYGGVLATRQIDLKRYLAYSSMSQMGYMLLGIASANYYGIIGSIIVYVNHAFAKAALFMIAGAVHKKFGTRQITELKDLRNVMPSFSTAGIMSLLSLSAVPPFVGFWGEIFVFIGLIKRGLQSGLSFFILSVMAILFSIFTSVYAIILMKNIFFGEKKVSEKPKENKLMLFPIYGLIGLSLLVGLTPNFVIKFISKTVEQLLGR